MRAPCASCFGEPDNCELNAISWTICERTLARLRERGLWLDAEPGNDSLAANQPLPSSPTPLCPAPCSSVKPGSAPVFRLFASVSSGTNPARACTRANNGFGFANASRSVSGAKIG